MRLKALIAGSLEIMMSRASQELDTLGMKSMRYVSNLAVSLQLIMPNEDLCSVYLGDRLSVLSKQAF